MYWFKLRRKAVMGTACVLLCSLYLSACRRDAKQTGTGLKYFDIKGYFTSQAAHLTAMKKPVLKSVLHNGASETKRVNITNWIQEFGLFTASDINKPAWKDSYTTVSEYPILMYRAKDPDLTTREILIKKEGQKIAYIMIFNYTKNMLYQNSEVLTYYPDSLYMLRKEQKVRFLGKNLYGIKAFINK